MLSKIPQIKGKFKKVKNNFEVWKNYIFLLSQYEIKIKPLYETKLF